VYINGNSPIMRVRNITSSDIDWGSNLVMTLLAEQKGNARGRGRGGAEKPHTNEVVSHRRLVFFFSAKRRMVRMRPNP